MTLPIWIILTFMALQVVTAAVLHGRPKPAPHQRYNAIITTGDACITLGLLYWAGLFQ